MKKLCFFANQSSMYDKNYNLKALLSFCYNYSWVWLIAYIFCFVQIANNMRPEMERAIKSYDPDLPEDPITKTFDAIQNQVSYRWAKNAPLEFFPQKTLIFSIWG